MSNDAPFIPSCHRCQKEMVEGYLPDFAHYSRPEEPVWVEGKLTRSRFLKILQLPDEKFPVRAFRCPQCGSLELFAFPRWHRALK
jgi:hypothetical protein